MTSLILQQAAKRFQQRATVSSSLSSIRTSWGSSDIEILAPLLAATQRRNDDDDDLDQQQQQQEMIAEMKSCEGVFIIWRTFVSFFSLFDSSSASTPGRTAQRFLQIHGEAYCDFEFLGASAAEFGRVASRGTPNIREFNVAYQAAMCFVLSGRVNEASLVLESMIQGVNAVIEARNLRQNNNNNNDVEDEDEDDAPDGPFSPEEQSVFEAVAHLLRVPYMESREALHCWRSAASKLLADVRSVAIVVPGRVPELDLLRRLTLQILFTISGDTKVLKETINTCAFLGGKSLWYAAGICALMSPLATRKQICDAIHEYGTVAQSATSFSPVRVTGGNNNNNGDYDDSEIPNDWDNLFISALACERACHLVNVVEHAVDFSTKRGGNNSRVATLAALMGAHLADLCCDLRDPDELMIRNRIVESYVRTLFVNFPGLWEIAVAYVTTSPLMDPQAIVLCLRHGAGCNNNNNNNNNDIGENLELTLRLYDEVIHPRCPHQEQLRLRWRRANVNIDWATILETVDIVVEEERRKLALERATSLWNDEARFVDAINLLVNSGNFTAAEHKIRCALENFASSANNNNNAKRTSEDGDDNNTAADSVSYNALTADAVICIGDAASLGQVADPTLEGSLQRKAAHNLILASNMSSCAVNGISTAVVGAPTPLALCRRISELYNARHSINILDFIFPIIADQNFGVMTSSSVKKFVLTLAVAHMNQASLEQLLVLNCVLQQSALEFGGSKGIEEQSKKILELLVQ